MDDASSWGVGNAVCVSLAGGAGLAIGLSLATLSGGLPPDAFLACSVSVLLGAAWLAFGVGDLPERAGVAAGASLGAAWSGLAVLSGREAAGTLCLALTLAIVLGASRGRRGAA